MLFSLYRQDYNKKEGPLPGKNRFLLFPNTSRRRYPDTMIRIFDLFCKLNDIKISDQEWFGQAIRSLNLSDQLCPYCNSKGHLISSERWTGSSSFSSWIPTGIPFSRLTMRQISITAEISGKTARMLPIIPACTICSGRGML